MTYNSDYWGCMKLPKNNPIENLLIIIIIIQDNKIHRPAFGLYESLVIALWLNLIGWSSKCLSSRFLNMSMLSASTTLFGSSFHVRDIRWYKKLDWTPLSPSTELTSCSWNLCWRLGLARGLKEHGRISRSYRLKCLYISMMSPLNRRYARVWRLSFSRRSSYVRFLNPSTSFVARIWTLV